MTTNKKAKKTPVKTQPADTKDQTSPAQGAVNRKRQIRLGFGIFFLLSGLFLCFSVLSYFTSWKTDQDKLLNTPDLWDFLFHSDVLIANWGGRLGAVVSHILVYRGVGIVALAISVWISLTGMYLVYGKLQNRTLAALSRYLRWLCVLLLVAAPILSYTMPDTSFPWGGAWGNESILYLNGLLGRLGTGLALFALVCFVAFGIFALDISPLLQKFRARRERNAVPVAVPADSAPGASAEIAVPAATPAPNEPAAITETEEITEPSGIDNDDPDTQDDWEMTLVDKTDTEVVSTPEVSVSGDEVAEANEAAADDLLPDEYSAEEGTSEADKEDGLSFEVIQQEEEPSVTIQHGGHITVQDNEPYAPELDLPDYKFPTLDLLDQPANETIALDKEELEKNKNQIIQTLKSFGIEIQRISATVGPTVTLYEIVPSEGVRISKIRNLEDDIALNLAALGIRIIAPIPGRGTIGIEVPNANKQIVSMRTLLSSEKFANSKMSLPIALGKKIDNENYIVDLAAMPHLLMAGATGQGKSVGINALLVSLLYKKHPSQLKFVLVDPKKVELSIYRVIEKHFLAKLPNEEEAIITDTKKVINTLNALCIEMDNRYELLKEAGTRNIKEYNEKFIRRRLNPEKGHKYLPFIVLVVDEFADLIMTAGKEVEMPIARLAQLARAVGIHLIVATQRPSVNVITGTIKANFPARIAFKVSAKVDSRTIIDSGGAEQLVGRGDMLISHGSELLRLQCAFVDTSEVEKIVNFIGTQRGYPHAFELPEYEGEDGSSSSKVLDITNRDDLFEECARLVVQTQSGSTSNLQRKFNLGYNRAGRIMDQLEAASIVGPAMGSKPREVYVKTEAELEAYL